MLPEMEEPGVGVAGRTKAAPAMKNLQVASRGCSRTVRLGLDLVQVNSFVLFC